MAASKGAFDSTAVARDYFELLAKAAGDARRDRAANDGSN
jgi:hypothetical protein